MASSINTKSRGRIDFEETNPRDRHVGSSNYSAKKIQPYDIWIEYQLNPWDADIVKRILRTKVSKELSPTESRIEDYEKIIHICQTRIQHMLEGNKYYRENE